VADANKARCPVPVRWDTFLKELPGTHSRNRNLPNKICVYNVFSDSRPKRHNMSWNSKELRHTLYGLQSIFEDINTHNQNRQSEINQ